MPLLLRLSMTLVKVLFASTRYVQYFNDTSKLYTSVGYSDEEAAFQRACDGCCPKLCLVPIAADRDKDD